MSEKVVLVKKEKGYVILTLNRPDKLNAFNEDQHRQLFVSLKEAAEDKSCRSILVTGAGKGFCAGQDLGDRDPATMDGPPDLGETLENFYNPLIRLIRSIEKPVICAVNGVAAGAGANIALACDIVIASRSAKFIQAFSKIGLVPDSGGTWFLTRLLGEARAKGLALTGAPITADQAMDWGVIWQVVDNENLQMEARKLAELFASGPTKGLALTKRAIHLAGSNDLDEQLELEKSYQRQAGLTKDYAEGVSAFLNKRKPEFTGQ